MNCEGKHGKCFQLPISKYLVRNIVKTNVLENVVFHIAPILSANNRVYTYYIKQLLHIY